MDIQLIDYVGDSKVEDGAVFNGFKVRVVGKEVLFDYAAINPTAAKILGMSGVADDEILLNKDTDSVNKDAVNHELNEDRILKSDSFLSYWEVHTELMKLSKNYTTNKSQEVNKMYAVKFYDEEKGIIEGLGIPYGGPARKDAKELGKDLTLEYFSEKTDFTSVHYDGKAVKSMPLLYHHGLDEDIKDSPIGEVVAIEDKPEGKWFKVQLNKANKYYEYIKRLVQLGKLLFSSGAIPEGVKKATDGFIEKWPLKEESLTFSPANPMQPVPSVKSLIEEIEKINPEVKVETKSEVKEEVKTDAIKTEKPEGSPEIKPDPSVPAAQQGHVEGHTMTPPPACPMKSIKCTSCGKAVQLPQPVLDALQALDDSIHEILDSQGTEGNPGEKPEEPKPEGDKPQAPSQPGTNQGMAPETHAEEKPVPPVKPEDKKSVTEGAVKAVEDKFKEVVKTLEERIKTLEGMPITNGPAKRAVKSTDNPHMAKENELDDAAREKFYDEMANDGTVSMPARQAAAQKAAELSMKKVVAKGPQRP